MSEKITAPKVRAMKGSGRPIVCVTAYDFPTGQLVDRAGVDVVLVGDSVGNAVLGLPNTLPVTLDQMVHHTAATARGVRRALLVADLPFGSYQSSVSQAVDSAVALVKAGAEAVKLEGRYPDQIAAIAAAGIPVMGHVGMTPQSVHAFGGFRVQGRGGSAETVMADLRSVAEAGAFSAVVELVPAAAARRLTESVDIPTIGIGAGPHCDGQIQVFYDILGFGEVAFRHAKQYADARAFFQEGLEAYVREVRSGEFPTEEHSF
ncbi:MAG: 3-methyl-2-oxobutanoate hydroxymethyltransferase [Fimbriimonadaceae bacterium]